jgi:hypothetical protein
MEETIGKASLRDAPIRSGIAVDSAGGVGNILTVDINIGGSELVRILRGKKDAIQAGTFMGTGKELRNLRRCQSEFETLKPVSTFNHRMKKHT